MALRILNLGASTIMSMYVDDERVDDVLLDRGRGEHRLGVLDETRRTVLAQVV